MPCFSTGIPVINDAIVGSRNAGFTAVADQVTAPSLTNRLRVGIVPPFRESWPNPSRTKRITCSVGAIEAGASADTSATAASLGRTNQRKNRDTASIRIGHRRSKLINLCTVQFFPFCSKGVLRYHGVFRQGKGGLASPHELSGIMLAGRLLAQRSMQCYADS